MHVTPNLFVCAGEALVDLIQRDDGRFEACLGGSVFNFAIALGRLGVPTAYANPLSQDLFGERFGTRLRDDAVACLSPEPVASPTSLAVVAVDAQGRPAYAFHRSEVADRRFELPHLLPAMAQARALHLGCFALVPADVDRYLQLVDRVRSAGGVITLDANLRPSVEPDLPAYVASVEKALRQADIVKVSDEDLLHLGRVRGLDDVHALTEAAAGLLKGPSPTRLVALTLGPRGAIVLTHEGRWQAAPDPATKVVDTVGAGDCFFAALNASLWRDGVLDARNLVAHEAELRRALARGIAGASINVGRVGCDPGRWDEVCEGAQKVVVHRV